MDDFLVQLTNLVCACIIERGERRRKGGGGKGRRKGGGRKKGGGGKREKERGKISEDQN